MPRYHITYKENIDDFFCKGYNVQAENEIIAINIYITEVSVTIIPNMPIFISMVCTDIISPLTKAQLDNDSKHGFTPSSH